MKRFSYFALSLVLGASVAPAQYRAGLSSVGGTFDFSLPDSGPKSLTIAPSYSYSLSEKLAIGAEMVFSGEGELRMFGVAPFVRGNLPINDRWPLLLDFAAFFCGTGFGRSHVPEYHD